MPTGSMEINRTFVVPTGTVRTLAISGIDHENVPIAIVDIPDALATGAEGILGLDVLARHDIVVDFADEEFAVFPAGTLVRSRREGAAARYERVELPVLSDRRCAVLSDSRGRLLNRILGVVDPEDRSVGRRGIRSSPSKIIRPATK